MEFLTIFLSSLIGLVSPTGLVVDRLAENAIRSQFVLVEQLQVRVDNVPSYQILNGKIDRLRIAGRGLFPIKDLRLEALELETDPIALQRRGRRFQLKQPIQAGVRLVLKPDDLNQALRSPAITDRLRNLRIQFLQRREAQVGRYDLQNLKVEFLPSQRVRLQSDLQEQGYPEKLKIVAEAELQVISGRSLRLLNQTILVNGQPAPLPIVKALTDGITNRLDLRRFEKSGITARILKLQVEPTQLQLTAFVQVRPKP